MTVTLSTEQYNALLARAQTAEAQLEAANMRADDEQTRAEAAEAREARLREHVMDVVDAKINSLTRAGKSEEDVYGLKVRLEKILADPTGQRVAEPPPDRIERVAQIIERAHAPQSVGSHERARWIARAIVEDDDTEEWRALTACYLRLKNDRRVGQHMSDCECGTCADVAAVEQARQR